MAPSEPTVLDLRITSVVAEPETPKQVHRIMGWNPGPIQRTIPPAPRLHLKPASLLARMTPPTVWLIQILRRVAASEESNTPVQVWRTINRKICTMTVGRRSAQESPTAARFLGPVRNPTEVDRRILFPRTSETPTVGRIKANDIVVAVNQTLAARKVPSHVQL